MSSIIDKWGLSMAFFRNATVSLLLIAFFGSVAVAEERMSISVKASLQAAMQQHIDRSLVNGVYLYLDRRTGDVRQLHPASAHPIIMRLNEYFVLCSDFRDGKGRHVNIDFYLAHRGRAFFVFDTLVDDRRVFNHLMKAGKVSRVN